MQVDAAIWDVARMKQCVGDQIKVKAAGGIRMLDDAFALVNEDAQRLGTSRGATILNELYARQ